MNTPKPMNPEWLDRMRRGLDSRDCAVEALLADRDYHAQRADAAERERDEYERACQAKHVCHPTWVTKWNDLEAEVARLRARVRVEVEDVERVGVTRQQVEAWLVANGWTTTAHTDGRLTFTLVRPRSTHYVHVDGWQFPWIANDLADRLGRLGLDIIDEMAAMEVS